MFGRRDMDEDPFFGSGIRNHVREMDNMFHSFMSPFGALNRPLGITAGNSSNSTHPQRQAPPMGALLPFGFGAGMLPNFDSVFENMRHQMDQASRSGNGQTYMQSSVMSYSSNGDGGRPKYYEATSSSHSGPSGVKETRKTVRDSEQGIEKMSIGHHIGGRGHVKEKRRDRESGQIVEDNEYINMDEDEAELFDAEFAGHMGQQQQPVRHPHHGGSNNRMLAIEGAAAVPTSNSRAQVPRSGANTGRHRQAQQHHHSSGARPHSTHRNRVQQSAASTHNVNGIEERPGASSSSRYARAPISTTSSSRRERRGAPYQS